MPNIEKRFKAQWTGDTDEEGFMTKGKFYTITRETSKHYCFVNNFGQQDLASKELFQKPRKVRSEN